MFDIWLYFIKIHNLNTYDTLYTRHKQLLDLTFSVISTENKYVNYLVRAKGLFRDSAFTVKGQPMQEANPNRPISNRSSPPPPRPRPSLHSGPALLVPHKLMHPHPRLNAVFSRDGSWENQCTNGIKCILQLCSIPIPSLNLFPLCKTCDGRWLAIFCS